MPFRKLLFACVLAAAAGGAEAGCDDLKAKIEAKFQAKGVTGYRLEALPSAAAADGKVVGTCEGGARKIVYSRGAARASAASRPAAQAAAPAARPQARKNRPPPALGNY